MGMLQIILDSSPMSCTAFDRAGNLLGLNQAAVDFHGFSSKEEFIDKYHGTIPTFQPSGQKSSEIINAAMEKIINTDKKMVLSNWVYQALDGRPRPAELSIAFVKLDDEEQFIFFARDMQEHYVLKEMQTVAQQRLQAMLDASPILCSIFRAGGEIIEVNQAALSMFGLKDKQEYIDNFSNFNPEFQADGSNSFEKARQLFRETVEKGRMHIEWLHQNLEGEQIPCDVYLERVYIGENPMVISYALDLREQKATLEKNERAQIMFDSTPLIIEYWDKEYNSLDCNKTALDFYGYSSKEHYLEEMREKPQDFHANGLSTWSEWNHHLEKAFINGFHQFEYTDIKQNGEFVVMESNCVCTKFGNMDAVVTYSSDVTQLRELQEEQQRIEVAEESSKAKSRFLARMSHEIRTPISAVLGISEIQLQNPKLAPDVEESFATIHSSAYSLLGIINDILDLSRIEAGKMSLQQNKYEVASLISNVTHLHLMHLGDKDIKFRLRVDENLPTFLIGDSLRIEQIMNNLLSNAFKYTESGSVELTFRCLPDEGGYVSLNMSIKDTGLGMNADQLEALGGDYTRFHEHDYNFIGGTGLGLPIVYNLAQLMDAEVEFESEVGIGTMVIVSMSQEIASSELLGEERASSLQQFDEGARIIAKRFNFEPEPMPYGKVLVVDDVEANLYVTKGLLAFYDIKVETCDNAHEALNKIKKGKVYDIVFMDFMMPNMNGTEAMKIMRGYGYTQPIVALTANAMIGKAEEFIREGFDSFISKPIQTKHLNTILMKYIRDRQPPEVIEAALLTRKSRPMQTDIEAYQRDAGLMKKLRTDFVRSQKNIIAEIRESANEGDIEKAHRLAHSLKGMAGLIHENALSSAAEQVERLLANRKIPPSLQMSVLDNELRRVLEDIGTSTAVELAPAKEFDKEKAAALFADLKGLLETSNVDCLNLLDELRSIPETAILVRQVENFDFAFALNSLKAIMEVYDM